MSCLSFAQSNTYSHNPALRSVIKRSTRETLSLIQSLLVGRILERRSTSLMIHSRAFLGLVRRGKSASLANRLSEGEENLK